MQNCASAIGVGVKGCIITSAQPMPKLGMLLKTRTELVPACVPFGLDSSKVTAEKAQMRRLKQSAGMA
eukprot:3953784-Pleurochrysis_carterae.AAC.1